MSIDITQDEMNILNLNGITYDDVKANIEFSRASGLDDETIRQQFTDTINQLQPMTEQSYNETGKIKEWQDKGAITPFEYAQRKSYLFDGTYSNIDNKANLSKVESVLANSDYNNTVEQRIEKQKQAKLERNQRVNEGTGSFIDRVGAAIDRWGSASLEAQKKTPSLEQQVQQNLTSLENNKDSKIDFSEAAANSFLSGEWTPFVGGYIAGVDDKKQRAIQEKIINNQPIRQDELDFLNARLEAQKEEAVRGYTLGGQIGSSLLPSMIRFSGEIATGTWALKSLGLMPQLAKGATLGQQAIHHGRNILVGGAVNTLLPTSYGDTFENYQNRLLQNGLQFTDKGEVIFQEAKEKPAISFMKSLGETFVMFASEHAGGLLGIPVKGISSAATKYVGSPIGQYIKSNPKLVKFVDKVMPELSKLYEKANKLKPQGKNFEFLKDMTKFDGFIEELGEEVVEDVLNLTLGTKDEERTLENYSKAIFKSPDEWAVLAGTIAIQGGLLSVGSHVLGSYMERNGATDEEIINTLNNLSEAEKRQAITQITSDGTLDVSEYVNEQLQAKEMYKESLFKQAKQAGYDDVRANTNAELIAESFANLAKQTGMSIEDIQNEANIVIQNLSDQEAIQQYNEDSRKVLQGRVEEVKYQSAASAGANENEVAEAEKEYAEKGTESKYFKRYFDGSKTVDEDGEPLILYHNTNNDFEIFSREFEGKANGRPVYGGGFNFTQYKDYAGQFGKKQMAVYLSIKNPLNEETYDAEKFIEPVAELMYGKDYKKYLLKYDDYYATGYLEGKLDTLYGLRDLMQGLQYDKGVDVIEFYKSLGYDGIQDGHIWIAFSPEQIKSVDNRGTFDANNPNIYYQAMIAGINPKQKVDVVDLSAAFVNDKNLSKAKLSSYIQTLIKPKTQNNNKISSKDKKALFSFIKRSKRVGKNDVYIPDHIANSSKVETQYKGERATFVNNIVNLIQHSVLIDIDKNKDKKTKPNVDNYLRFYVPVRINNDIFTVRITAENNVSENLFNILNADVYDVIIDKKMSSSVLIPANKQRNIMKMTSNNIITQSQQSSSVEKITIEEMLKGVQNPEKKLYFQSIDNIKQNFDYSAQELEEMFKADVLNILQENMIDESEFNFEDIKLYGSFSTNKNKKGSDLDFLVQYSGEMREDDAFNLLNEQGLTITDVNGNEVKVDFNPIRTDVTGSIDEYLKNNSKIYFQSAASAGANENDIAIAEKEYAEKGTESKYFKKWTDNAPFVPAEQAKSYNFKTGEKVAVEAYHGTNQNIIEFDYSKRGSSTNAKSAKAGFWFVDNKITADSYADFASVEQPINELQKELDRAERRLDWKRFDELTEQIEKIQFELLSKNLNERGAKTFNVYVKFENPYVFDAKNNTFMDIQTKINNVIQESQNNNYDGVIIKNLKDKPITGEYGEQTSDTHYLAFQNTQIKSVNNRGTFDANNPNIYFQPIEDDKLRFVQITDRTENEVELNNSIWLSTQTMAKEGLSYNNQKIGATTWLDFSRRNLKDIDISKLKNIQQITENQTIEKEKHNPEIETIAEEYFGTTTNLKEAGYVLSNGKLLDLSGKKFGGVAGRRSIDHREINDAFLENDNYNEIGIEEFIDNGAIRYMPEASRLLIARMPSNEQFAALENIINKNNGEISIEMVNNMSDWGKSDKSFYKDYEMWSDPKKVLDDVRTYFNGGKISEHKTYYQSIEDDSNLNDTERGIINSRGFTYEKEYFDGQAKENIIVLLKNKADASTLIHEFAHVYLITLNNLARNNVKAKELLLTVNKWLRYDGREYTTAQHEKFANGFVAYVKAGKAPSYGLKRVFENFRRWLGDIWNSVSQSDEFEIDEEYSKVFNQLLGDVSVQNQDEMIEKIIDDAKQNAALRLLNENIENGDVKFNELTETQRRYRDTAYEIIFTALKNSKDEETRNYVQTIADLRMKLGSGSTKSLQRQKERIEFLLSELDDPFSASDGFLPEWGEFFTDTGVSYDNQEVGADAELALDALDVIVNKKYLFSDNNFGELSEREVKQYEYEYEYILNQYKYANDKTIPMTAFYQWTGTIHPYLQDEFYKKWENETNEIDRYQNLSKFEQAKEDLKYKAAQMQGLGDYSQQFAEYAREIIKRLDFMTERDKARIFDKLKDFNSFREVQANLDDVMDFAETLYNVTERRKIADDIIREVKQTIHEWKDGIKRTKYTYPANKLFERLRELNKLPQQDIQDIYDAQVNEEIKPTYEADKVNTDDYYETIEKMFIEFKANGVYYNSSEFLQDLLTRIQNAKFTAKIARDEMDFERRMQAINLIDDCAKAVAKHKGKTSTLEKLYRLGFNLNSALEMMFDKNTKEKFTLDYLYAQKDAKVGADRDVVLIRLKDVFGFQGKLSDTFLFNQFINMTKKEFTLHQRYTPDIAQGVIRQTHRDKETGLQFTDKTIEYSKGKPRTEWEAEEIQLSRMELLYYYILSMNEDTYNILTDMGSETQAPKGQFDKYELEEAFNQLTPQEKMMGVVLQQAAEKYWPELNKYHIKKYHTELGKTKNYFPRKTELTEVKPLELFNDYVQYSGKISAQKQRTAGLGSRIAPANALAVLFDHIEKANTLITMGEQLDLMNRVFKDPNLKKKIEAVWGIDTTNEFYNHIAGNLYSGQQSIISDAEKHIGRLSSNVIKAQIFAKAQVGLKQIISFLNYGTGDEFVSSSEWGAAFWKQSFTPKEWKKNIEYMMNIPYLKDRFGRGGSTDALKRELETRLFAKMSLLDDFFSLPIKVGDMGAIILGGKPYIDVLIQKGYTEEQAQKIFIEKTVNEMQSSIPSTLSNMQRNAAKQPLTKMIFAYQNTPWQYFRVAANSIIQFKQNPNKYTGLNMVKIVGLYMYVFPLIFNLASSFSPLTGDEDELMTDLWKSALGNFMFIPIGGMFIMAMLNGALGERISTGNWFDTAAAKAGNMARKIAKGDDITVVDMLKVIALFGEMWSGLPLTTLGTEVSGVYDIATGSPTKGTLKVAGYSDYRAKKVSGEEK